MTKKELKVNVPIEDDFEYYVNEILSNITDDTFDMNSNSTSKFSFYHFNTFTQAQGKLFLAIRHSITANDDYALEVLQNNKRQYFIETLLYLSKEELNFVDFEEGAKEENEIIENTFENLSYCKTFYKNVFDDIAYFFHRKIKDTHDTFIEKIEDDLAREIYYHKKF